MPATLSRCTSQAVSRDDQPSPGSRSMRCGPSSTSRCQATMNIAVGTTSMAFSTSAATGEFGGYQAADDADGDGHDPGNGDEVEEQPEVGEEEAEALRQHFAERQSHDLASSRFFAGALLGGAERVGQPLRGAARPQRLGLGARAAPSRAGTAPRSSPRRGRTAGRSARRRSPRRAAAWPAAPGRAGARPPGCSRPWRRGRASGRAHCRIRPRWSRCRPPAGRSPRAAAGPPRRADRRTARRAG